MMIVTVDIGGKIKNLKDMSIKEAKQLIEILQMKISADKATKMLTDAILKAHSYREGKP